MIFSERTFKDTEDPQMTTTDLESQNGDTGTSERNRRTQKHHKGLEWLQETKDPGLRKCLQRLTGAHKYYKLCGFLILQSL